MRACFLGQNICALGYGVATLQTPPLQESAAEADDKIQSNPLRPKPRPAYPVVIPADGHEYGRPGFYPLSHPLGYPVARPLGSAARPL